IRMASSVWKGRCCVVVGLLALGHAALLAAPREYDRNGTVRIAGEFKNADASSELRNKAFDTLRNRPSFSMFNHRGGVLFRPLEQEASQSSAPQALPSNPLWLRKFHFHI
uniref:Uncharacterized protein n=1 Tax=Scleropages formosus TaxID=113540 RepID=A0A8C9RBP3_SCLFO